MFDQQNIQNMTLHELEKLYDKLPFEFYDGKVHLFKPMTFGISTIQKNIYLKFFLYTQESQIGEVYGWLPIVLSGDMDRVKRLYKPAIAFFTYTRLQQYYEYVEDYRDKPMLLVPDIVVEIVSTTDSYSDVNRKVALYLEDGVKIIWVVDPKLKNVAEHTQEHPDAIMKHQNDVLSGGEVAQRFELGVSEIFEG